MNPEMIHKYVNRNVFFYEKGNQYIKLQQPPSFIAKNLESFICEELKYYLTSNRKFVEMYFNFGRFGHLI